MTGVVHPGDDRLIDLAARLLPPPLEAETLRHLEACPSCELRFRSVCRDAELARLGRPEARRSPRWRFAAIAASVLLAAVSIAVLSRRPARVDPADYWFPVENERVGLRTGATNADDSIFNDAIAAYRHHDPALVVTLLHGRTIPERLDPIKIMLASALVKTGDPAQAEVLLTEVRIETLPQPDRDRASWILFAALTLEGKRPEARAVAEELASRPGEFAHDARRAAEALGQTGQ